MTTLLRKLSRLASILLGSTLGRWVIGVPFLPLVLLLRIVLPIRQIRLCRLHSLKLGHFTANTELHLCEKDAQIEAGKRRYLDLYFYANNIVCNMQLAKLWERTIPVFPGVFMRPLFNANKLIPGHAKCELDIRSQSGRDVNGLLDITHPHLRFTDIEEQRGRKCLEDLGIEGGAPFVCVTFRDHAYFDNLLGPGRDARDSYRNADISTFGLAAEELTKRGYFVVRMGAKVEKRLQVSNRRIIDYASSGKRTEFLDIYLGAKCTFAVSTQTGWDGIPFIFRRPICWVNSSPISYFLTSRKDDLLLTKHHFLADGSTTKLCLSKIFECGANSLLHSDEYRKRGIILRENTAEELVDIVTEMDERIKGTWRSRVDDVEMQLRFKEIYRRGNAMSGCSDLHGELRANYSAWFLRKNPDWLA